MPPILRDKKMRVLRNARVAATIVALGTIIATSSAQAALQTLTVNIDQYASAVDHTPGEILATVTIADLAAGGVNVDVSLDKAIYFASTGGRISPSPLIWISRYRSMI
jgi:hypothetical protein